MAENRNDFIDMNGEDPQSEADFYREDIKVNETDDPLHPIMTVNGDIKLQNASIIFEPKIGCNQTQMPYDVAYALVKNEIDKVIFKYGLKDWKLKYANRVDTPKRGAYYGGTCCVLTHIPYATYNIELAKDLIISYCTEIMALLNQESAALYFDPTTIFYITCEYDPEILEYDRPKLVSSEVTEYKTEKSATCLMQSNITTAAKYLQDALINIESDNSGNYCITPLYLYTTNYNNQNTTCILISTNIQNHIKVINDSTKYENSIRTVIKNSKLNFTNLTVI